MSAAYDIRDAARTLAEVRDVLDGALPASREKALVLTKIDEARLWLKEATG